MAMMMMKMIYHEYYLPRGTRKGVIEQIQGIGVDRSVIARPFLSSLYKQRMHWHVVMVLTPDSLCTGAPVSLYQQPPMSMLPQPDS